MDTFNDSEHGESYQLPMCDLKMICNDFLPTWLKVVSSCLLQYKPVCVTNFDKLCRKILKITSLLVFLVGL